MVMAVFTNQAGKSSKEIIRHRLEAQPGQWVSAWDLAQLCIEYKRPIWQLRHQDNLNIENRTERVRGKVHGYYRLMPAPAQSAPEPGWKSEGFAFGSHAAPHTVTTSFQRSLDYETGKAR